MGHFKYAKLVPYMMVMNPFLIVLLVLLKGWWTQQANKINQLSSDCCHSLLLLSCFDFAVVTLRTVLLEQATKIDSVSPINKREEVLDIDLIHMLMFRCQDVND